MTYAEFDELIGRASDELIARACQDMEDDVRDVLTFEQLAELYGVAP